jgi:hypothetical protein
MWPLGLLLILYYRNFKRFINLLEMISIDYFTFKKLSPTMPFKSLHQLPTFWTLQKICILTSRFMTDFKA